MKEFIIGRYDRKGNKKFSEYLKNLSVLKNPFKCQYLRVIPEDMGIKRPECFGGAVYNEYKKGELRCIAGKCKEEYKPPYFGECSTSFSIIKPNRKRELEMICSKEKTKILMKIEYSINISEDTMKYNPHEKINYSAFTNNKSWENRTRNLFNKLNINTYGDVEEILNKEGEKGFYRHRYLGNKTLKLFFYHLHKKDLLRKMPSMENIR